MRLKTLRNARELVKEPQSVWTCVSNGPALLSVVCVCVGLKQAQIYSLLLNAQFCCCTPVLHACTAHLLKALHEYCDFICCLHLHVGICICRNSSLQNIFTFRLIV